LINLGGNAVKFTSSGWVLVAVRLAEASAGRAAINFVVRDTGIGIAPAQLASIFEGFSQAEASTTRRYGGTGLGLAIARRLVELMGGTLAVESEVGHGSEFSFMVPFEVSEPLPVTTPPPEPPPLHALLVDDSSIAREALAATVRSIGWTCEDVDSGAAAIERVLSHAPRPFDIVLLDQKMPGLSGIETARILRERARPRPLLVMVTAHAKEALTGDTSAVDGLLSKPMTASMLLDLVAEITSGEGVRRGARGDGAPTSPRLSGLRVLLVEDNAVNQEVAREILESEGAEVDMVDSGGRAVERVVGHDQGLDVVLMDVQMPDMDGFEATRRIRSAPRGARVPIVAMTAHVAERDRIAAEEAGMDAHLAKPIDVEQLVATLRRYLPSGAPHPSRKAEGAAASPAMGPVLGIDLAGALDRLGGQRPLYARLARHFRIDEAGVVLDIERALRAGDRATAGRLSHTLKGLAATLGATELSARAADLEAALRDGADQELVEVQLPRLKRRLREALDALDALAGALGAPPVERRRGLDVAGALLELNAIIAALDGGDIAACDRYASFVEAYGEHLPKAALAPIDEAMQKVDFIQASAFCRRLRREIGDE
jgi:CheY-like chemotaxis protein/HPt (histidine-containing phosphotransfer) domain-containing protein